MRRTETAERFLRFVVVTRIGCPKEFDYARRLDFSLFSCPKSDSGLFDKWSVVSRSLAESSSDWRLANCSASRFVSSRRWSTSLCKSSIFSA
eukprot:m.311711 g.311711  ORF g.311711 m.311711 type:complete len:92 (+) comp127257_c0_seq1:487-762(+)